MKCNVLAIAAVLVGGVALSACGSSSANNTTTTTGKKAPSSAAQLRAITKAANSGKSATFQATWTSTSGGTTQSVTLEQSPPKSKFTTGGGGFVLNDGSATYFCSSTSSCLKESTGTNPLGGLFSLYNGSSFVSAVSAYSNSAFLAAAGVSLKYSTQTFSGISSTCLNISIHRVSGTRWCVSNKGVLTYWSAGTSKFVLTSYSTSVPAADLALPVGATITTLQ